MSKSIRGTFTRPNVDTVWSMYIFLDTVVANIERFNATGHITTYMKGNPATDLSLVVDHVFDDEVFFESYKEEAYKYIPSWGTPETIDEVNSYAEDNGLTLVLEEVDNPDLTGYQLIEEVPLPPGMVI